MNAAQRRPASRFGILGLAYDTSASLGWPGARYAPDQIRASLQWILNRIQGGEVFDVEGDRLLPMGGVEIRDFGNARIGRFDHERSLRELQAAIEPLLREGYTPILLGGDHSVTWPGIAALHEASREPLGIVQLDAHLDLLDESDVQGRYSGSSEMRRALELPRVSGRNVVQVGVRGYNYPEHFRFIRQQGITLIPPGEIRREGARQAARRAMGVAGDGTARVYLTVDIDVLDSAHAPGSGANEPGGLEPRELLEFVREAAPGVDVLDVVEVNPLTDHRSLTGAMAARLVFDFIVAKAFP